MSSIPIKPVMSKAFVLDSLKRDIRAKLVEVESGGHTQEILAVYSPEIYQSVQHDIMSGRLDVKGVQKYVEVFKEELERPQTEKTQYTIFRGELDKLMRHSADLKVRSSLEGLLIANSPPPIKVYVADDDIISSYALLKRLEGLYIEVRLKL